MSDSHMRRAFSALSEVTPAIAKVTCIDDLLHLVARQACDAGRRGALLHLHARGAPEPVPRLRRLLRRRRRCPTTSSAGSPAIPADGVTREMLETRRPVIVANARQDPRMVKVDGPPLEDPLDHGGADDLQRRGRRPDPARRRRPPARVQRGGGRAGARLRRPRRRSPSPRPRCGSSCTPSWRRRAASWARCGGRPRSTSSSPTWCSKAARCRT